MATTIPSPQDLHLTIAGLGGPPRYAVVAALAPFAIALGTGNAEEKAALAALVDAFDFSLEHIAADRKALALARTIVAALTPGSIGAPSDEEAEVSAAFGVVASWEGYFTGSNPSFSYTPNAGLLIAYARYLSQHEHHG